MVDGISSQREFGCGIHRHGLRGSAGTAVSSSVAYTYILVASSGPLHFDTISIVYYNVSTVNRPIVIGHVGLGSHF